MRALSSRRERARKGIRYRRGLKAQVALAEIYHIRALRQY
ncbi:hypothetical protein COLSTE_01467 [Collinsella stercoris DSM 13279]|uniref:Uncharacterized protein n=1 Tax=Collinsella stercoris DSM 13279 TaxID=445975 RepID=B6GBK7_9ACTN|nr:hypothetical protein COLSTE_01467 [Collinsella stercoris DSM 13279]